MNQKELAPLSPKELNLHHFGDEWRMAVPDFHHLFHINRLEDVIPKIKFPLQPHRKTVNDFFFLTEGHSVRSKGLYQYELSRNTFFFLPAFQISTHEFVSPESKGFYCHTEKYKNLLLQHIYTTNKVADYASMLAITPDHLNKCVRSTVGRTSQELLADMIILEAKVFLKQTNLSINEIAFKFSETNPSDFSRFFKSKTKVSPKEFRKNAAV